ncbi:MAG: sulfatase [Planctomycetes bacterium]|nr:sulfatase [Planctomycetota bacterium]
MSRLVRQLLSAFGLVALACTQAPERAAPRHLIVVTVDTLRADHLTAWGYARGTSDAAGAAKRGSAAGFTLDELAAQGVRFAQAYTPRGETFPALCSLFSGKPPPETGVLGNRETLPATVTTLAERLKAAGFHTAAFTTNKLLVPGSGIEQGFDVFESDFGDERDARVLERAAAWIEAQPSGARVFAWVHLMGPHLPYEPRPSGGVDFARLFADPAYAGTANGSREYVDAAYTQQKSLTDTDRARLVALYDGEIARVDQLVSRFAGRLAQPTPSGASTLDDALFALCADHGEELGERSGYFGHSKSISSAVLQVPLFLRWPRGVKAGLVRDDVALLEDVFPTVLATFGLAPERGVRGLSLDRLARGERDERFAGRVAIGLWRFSMFSVADARHRLVFNPDELEPDEIPPGPYPIPAFALYDRAADPRETVDVSERDAARARELQAALRAWMRGLTPSTDPQSPLSPERMRALSEQGYAGGEK